MDFEELEKIAEICGFTNIAPLDVNTIELKQEVRDMCSGGKCHKYNTNWACPPACGTVEECRNRLAGYTSGVIVQTVGQLEDALDGEAMVETARQHDINVRKMQDELIRLYPDVMTLGAGCCNLCRECTYPDNPCRMPEKRHSSMEAYGMVVSEVCKANNVKYYYGQNTIAYTGCFLFR